MASDRAIPISRCFYSELPHICATAFYRGHRSAKLAFHGILNIMFGSLQKMSSELRQWKKNVNFYVGASQKCIYDVLNSVLGIRILARAVAVRGTIFSALDKIRF
jgi:hypothetical protein